MLDRRASFVIAGVASSASLTAASAPSPLYPVYQRLWGFSAFTLTVVFAVYVFALLVALLSVGSLSDRVGRRPVASAALVLLALGTVLFTVAGSAGDLMVARVVQGFAVGAATATTTAMILDTASGPRVASMVSSAVPGLGIAIGAVLAGALVEFAPHPRQLVFGVLAVVYLLVAGLVWVVPEPARRASGPRRSLWRALLPDAGLPVQARATFVAQVPSIGATWALAGLYLSLGSSIIGTVLGVSSHFVVGLMLGAFFAGGVAGVVLSTLLPTGPAQWGGYGALAVGVLLTVAATLGSTLPLYVVGSVVAGIGFGATFRYAVDAIGKAAPPDQRGRVFATMYIVSYLAFSVPALGAGLAAQRLGLEPTAVTYGLLDVALVAVAAIAGFRRTHRRVSTYAPDPPDPASPASPVRRTLVTPRHRTSYLECGPGDGPLMVFVHGWPATGLIWRAQLEAFAADGWHCIAPDLRGYGDSSTPAAREAYTIENVVADLAELHDHVGGDPAIWVGHDWGSAVVGALAAHEPRRCRGAVLTSWAYFPDANSLATLVPLVDRTLYPADEFPDGQWDYFRYYTTHFAAAVADLDADPAAALASIYRPGAPDAVSRVSTSATVTRDGGRFGAAHRAPATQVAPDLWPAADFSTLVEAFARQGFGAPCAWYTNDDANTAYARRAPDGGRLTQPVLFINGEWDAICTITGNRQGDPMRAACDDLSETSLPAGHWLPLERKAEVVRAIRDWLRTSTL